MALDASRLETAMAATIKTEVESAFNLLAIPNYDAVEFKKFADAMAKAISSVIIPEFVDNAELDSAVVTDNGITGTVTGSSVDGTIDDPAVNGGIK